MASFITLDLGQLFLCNECEMRDKMLKRFDLNQQGQKKYTIIRQRGDYWSIKVPERLSDSEIKDIFEDRVTEHNKQAEIERQRKEKWLEEEYGLSNGEESD